MIGNPQKPTVKVHITTGSWLELAVVLCYHYWLLVRAGSDRPQYKSNELSSSLLSPIPSTHISGRHVFPTSPSIVVAIFYQMRNEGLGFSSIGTILLL
jgi:hypothetical protein